MADETLEKLDELLLRNQQLQEESLRLRTEMDQLSEEVAVLKATLAAERPAPPTDSKQFKPAE
jgi:hypothetical protein